MKMMYNGTQIKSLNIKHYEMDTNSATAQPSDLQVGVTCFGKGKKITGTGKAFSFATYGMWRTNESDIIPTTINVFLIGSLDYPIKMTASLNDIRVYDFSTSHVIAEIVIDGINYPISVTVQNGEFVMLCEKTVDIYLFMGKDEYI